MSFGYGKRLFDETAIPARSNHLSDSLFVISAPQDSHFTARQMAIRGSGAEHCGQFSATQDMIIGCQYGS